ncbi:MAG: sigma 54-interacting transcriptional regulator [Thermodesulfobacteriota bacterium]
MADDQKTQEQLISECVELRDRLAKLEKEKVGWEQVQHTLAESQAFCSAMVNGIEGFLYVCSEQHDLEFVNQRLVQKIGRNPTGEKCFRALGGLERVCPWCVGPRVSRGETVQWELLSPQDLRWYSVVYTPLRRSDGSVSWLSLSRDISRRMQMEEELILARDELEKRVEERTADLSRSNDLLRQEIAERQRTEDALRKSESTYKELTDLLPCVVFELDIEGRFLLLNRSGLEALGCTDDEAKETLSIGDVVVPTDRKRLERNISRVLKGNKLVGAEYTFRRQDDTTFPVLLYASPISRDQEILGIRGAAFDISYLRKTQDALWLKDSAIASSINAIAMADLDGNLTYVNPSFLKIWGHEKAQEVLGRPAEQFWGRGEQGAEVLRALREQGWWIGELKAWRKNGTWFEVQLSATLVTDKNGQPICIMGSFLDITERKRLRDALRSSEERFRAIFEGARDCIFMKDRSLRYTHVNPAVGKLLGTPASGIVGRRPEEVFGEAAGRRITEVNLRALKGQSIEGEATRTVRGEDLTFHEITVPLCSPKEGIIGTCTISRNVTELRKTRPVPRIVVRDYPSKTMRATLEKARHVALKDSIVLLQGESGSGKDYVAQWIHRHSQRASGPFFSINCAALPTELAESELFGHQPGAFTGARGKKRGLLELAEGGTLLLNEIGELSLSLQAKLLTFLDTRSFMRVGGERQIFTNARLIAATHRNLDEEVAAGTFLPPLFYRLNVFAVEVPPLRRRLEDIPILCDEILTELASEMHLTELPVVDAATMEALTRYLWPGNVRELRNVLERALILWDKGPFELRIPGLTREYAEWSHEVRFPDDRSLHEVAEEVKAAICGEALRRCAGNKKEASQMLGISRFSFYRYLKPSADECEDPALPEE